MRSYRFWYHYNKPLSKRMGRPTMTVHFKDRCIYADNIICHVPTETHQRKRQPRMVVRGFAKTVTWVTEKEPRTKAGQGTYTLVIK